ncbi:hypothetical protein [Mycoplasmopsis agalactiae]|uniref:hypothetical protein n=2 Tax=Mycoplasmopsis agalactiae TaxID=2110 RepID=UPI002F3E2D08
MNKKFKILTPIAAVYVVAAIITSVVFASPQNNLDKSRLEKLNDPINSFGDPKNIELKDDTEKVEKFLNTESSISDINGFISKSAINTSNMTSTNSAINQQSKNNYWFLNTKFWEDLNFDFIGFDEESKQKDDKKKAEKSKLDAKSESKSDSWYNNTKFWENLGFDFITSDHNTYKTDTKVIEIYKIKEIIEEKEKKINSVNEASSEKNEIKEKSVDDLEKMLAELEKRLFGSFRDAVIVKENIDKEISNLEKNKEDNESKLNEYINKRKEAGERLTKENDEYFEYKKLIEVLQEKLKKIKQK